jgi:DnaJ-class molecular chaperone
MDPMICPRCKGKGEIRRLENAMFFLIGYFLFNIECPVCEGKAVIEDYPQQAAD